LRNVKKTNTEPNSTIGLLPDFYDDLCHWLEWNPNPSEMKRFKAADMPLSNNKYGKFSEKTSEYDITRNCETSTNLAEYDDCQRWSDDMTITVI